MTGGGRGRCVVPVVRGPVAYPPAVFGRSGGGSRGRGHRWMYYATGLPGWMRFGGAQGVPAPAAAAPTQTDELDALRAQAEAVRGQLDALNARIAALGRDE